MKILITTMQNNDGKKIVSTQFLSEETENIKHELIELEPLPDKEGYTQEVIYDKAKQQYKMQYKEIPKSELEIVKEELKKTNQALQEFLLSQVGDEE